jgi:hypothetical protein
MGSIFTPLGLIRVHRVDPKMPKQRGLLESPLTPALSPLEQGGTEVCHFNIPTPTPP